MLFRIFAALVFLSSGTAFAQINAIRPDSIETWSGFRNYIRNPSARENVRFTTVSNGTLTRDTDAGDNIDGIASYLCDINSTGGFCMFQTSTIQVPDTTGSCEARITYKGDASTYTLRVTASGPNLVEIPLVNVTDWTDAVVQYPCGSARDVRVVQPNAGDGPAINIGRVYWGKSTSIGTVSQPRLVASYSFASTCNWSTTSATFVNVNADTDCTATLLSGTNLSLNANALSWTMVTVPGTYVVKMNFMAADGGSNTLGAFTVFDGTTNSGTLAAGVNVSGANTVGGTSEGVFSYTSGGSRTFNVRGRSDVGGQGVSLFTNDGTGTITVYFYPTVGEQVFRADTIAWKVDASISGTNPSLGIADVGTYAPIESTNLTLTNRTGVGNIPARIGCSGTNPATGTTCSAGNESVSVNFQPRSAGTVRACIYFGHQIDFGGTYGQARATFQLVTTGNANNVIDIEGGTKVPTGGEGTSIFQTYSGNHCSFFFFPDTTERTIRLMYEQDVSLGALDSSLIITDADVALGQRDIRITVEPIDQIMPAPLIANSVLSRTSGIAEFNWINGTCSGASAINSQSGFVSTIGNISSGTCTITLPTGVYSSAPICTSSFSGSTPQAFMSVVNASSSATSLTVSCNQNNVNCSSFNFNMICAGAR